MSEPPSPRVVAKRRRLVALSDGDPIYWTREVVSVEALNDLRTRDGWTGIYRIVRVRAWRRLRQALTDRRPRYLGCVVYPDGEHHLIVESLFAAPFVLTDGTPGA